MAYTTIDDPSAHFQALSYSGGSGSLARTFGGNSDLQPDLTWHKSRGQTYDHYLFDSNRGVGLYIKSNSNVGDDGSSGDTTSITSFDSDGFTLPGGTGISDPSAAIMCWGWKANGGTTTSNSASGDIKASVTQRDDTAKFAICTYTGTGINAGQSHRVNHGLGTTPHVMLFKSRGTTGDWVVYHHKNTSAPETDYLVLNSTAATVDSANKFNDTAPNSSYATIGGDDNISSGTMILYSFAEVQGYSKFGSYIGNGNDDGPFVYTGFKPAWLMYKRSSDTGNWRILDHKREAYNVMGNEIYVDLNNAAADDDQIDFLSNGFKLRNGSSVGQNGDGSTYIYMAFAEYPFVSSEGVPCTAR